VLTNLRSTTKEHVDPLHDVILFGVVRVLFAGDFQDSGNSLIIILQHVSNIIRNVLIDKNYANVITRTEVLKCLLHLFQSCVRLNNEEVGVLRRTVANPREEEARYGVLKVSTINK